MYVIVSKYVLGFVIIKLKDRNVTCKTIADVSF